MTNAKSVETGQEGAPCSKATLFSCALLCFKFKFAIQNRNPFSRQRIQKLFMQTAICHLQSADPLYGLTQLRFLVFDADLLNFSEKKHLFTRSALMLKQPRSLSEDYHCDLTARSFFKHEETRPVCLQEGETER